MRSTKQRTSATALDNELQESNSDNVDLPSLCLIPLFNDLEKQQPRWSDDDTEETLVRLKEDILTIYTSYVGKGTK